MVKRIGFTLMFSVLLSSAWAQLTESDTLRFGYSANVNGSWITGNVERLLISTTAEVSHVGKSVGIKSSNSYLYGVLAIVITLMVLEIRIPAMAEHVSSWDAFYQLYPILPKLLAYALSFIMIIIFWVNHHQLFQSIRLSSRGLLWLNSVWLFWICLLPFATAFLGEHPFLSFGVFLFCVELFLCALTFYLFAGIASETIYLN